VRYRLPISATALVFLLTSREELRLRVRRTVCEPSVSRLLGIRSIEASEGQGPAPQQALVARCEAKSAIGGGKCVQVVREAPVCASEISPGTRVEWREFGDALIGLQGISPAPHARVRIASYAVQNRIRSNQGLCARQELVRFIGSPLDR